MGKRNKPPQQGGRQQQGGGGHHRQQDGQATRRARAKAEKPTTLPQPYEEERDLQRGGEPVHPRRSKPLPPKMADAIGKASDGFLNGSAGFRRNADGSSIFNLKLWLAKGDDGRFTPTGLAVIALPLSGVITLVALVTGHIIVAGVALAVFASVYPISVYFAAKASRTRAEVTATEPTPPPTDRANLMIHQNPGSQTPPQHQQARGGEPRA